MSFFGGPKTPAPTPTPTVDEVDHEAEEERRRAQKKEKARRGRSSTVLTGSTGDTSEVRTKAKVLGG